MRGGFGGAFRPVDVNRVSCSGVSLSTSAWTQIVAAVAHPASALQIYNSSGSIIQLAVGGVGSEVAIPHYILPGASSPVIAFELSKGVRLSAKAIDAVPSTGDLILNSFG